MDRTPSDDRQWERIRKALPDDLESSAHITGAVKRQLRTVDSVAELLRMLLVYAVSDWGARLVVAWAAACHISTMSDVMMLEHLATSQAWLAWLFVQQLREATGCGPAFWRFTVVLTDATTVNRPGKKGTDYRVHLVLSLTGLSMVAAEVTDHKGGETLARFEARAGQLWIGDRGYGYRKGIWAVVKAGADVLVRLGWQSVHLLDAEGETLDLLEAAKAAKVGTPLDIPVTVGADPKTDVPAFPARVIIIRKSKEEAAKARKALEKRYSKLSRTAKAKTFAATEFVFLLTTASAQDLPAGMAAGLYRLRWQIEIFFKQQKSLFSLDDVRCKTAAATKAVLYAKLLAMVLFEKACSLNDVFSREEAEAPLGTMVPRWRIKRALWTSFQKALGMFLDIDQWLARLRSVMHRLREPRRERVLKRIMRWAVAPPALADAQPA